MLSQIPTLRRLLNVAQRRQALTLTLALAVRAAIQLLGVASIAPFMAVAIEPSLIQENDWLFRVYRGGGFTSHSTFLLAAGLATISLVVIGNLVSAATSWAQLKLVWDVQHTLALQTLREYLDKPYDFLATRNSASLHQNVLAEVQTTVMGALVPALNCVSQGLSVLLLTGLLFVVNSALALTALLTFGGTYAVFYASIRGPLGRLGEERLAAHRRRYQIAAEVLAGAKDIKVLQREGSFLSRFEASSLAFTRAHAASGAMVQLPRHVLETVAFGGIVASVLLALRSGHQLTDILPLLSLYAFAGYRLIPALQSLLGSFGSMRYHFPALRDLLRDLEQTSPTPESSPLVPLEFERQIRFENVSFGYPDSETLVLSEVDLTIEKNATIGIVGPTGSGKSTLVDLLLGLYSPTSGRIRIDGVALERATIPHWRRQIGYVPQEVFLTDDTIAANIALGLFPEEIDQAALERAACAANLHPFVSSLPRGYSTLVGERGVRLSGGQRQRIGIARALYHDPAVLVLDEATSSLDNVAESAVLNAIDELAGSKTLVIIAHRPSTVARCDEVYRTRGDAPS